MNTTSKLKFSYQPPPGGDVSLKSSDGVVFLAHSLLLRLASSVFTDMFSTATQNDVVELTDDSESVSLMLRFIYPPVFMDNLSTELLEKSLQIAHKYDASGIAAAVDHILVYRSSDKGSLINFDPIHAFCLGGKYGLPGTQTAAAAGLRPEQFIFNHPGKIKAFADAYASAAGVIGLLGAHCVRIRALLDVLLKDNEEILPNTSEHYVRSRVMMCEDCFDNEEYLLDEENSYEPSWYNCWKILAFCTLASATLDKSNHLFQASVFDIISSKPNICLDCIHAARTAGDGESFTRWARRVKDIITRELDKLECLYDL
ncbi:hypothetical protein FRC12_008554 [Ceratobasidium sp. 428]|nr:hypothetical protein FRC12_008554 [Ceratobasidium sp. 428]